MGKVNQEKKVTHRRVVRVGFTNVHHEQFEEWQRVYKLLNGSKPSKKDLVIVVMNEVGIAKIKEMVIAMKKELRSKI